jgi:hypothetical protein
VPNELLLDIKKLAEYESGSESLMGEVFDRFHAAPESANRLDESTRKDICEDFPSNVQCGFEATVRDFYKQRGG